MTKHAAARTPGGLDGARVRERRLALGLTQADLATRSGLSQEAISRIENGRILGLMQPTQDALAGALTTTVGWLRGDEGDPGEHAPPVPEAPAADDVDASDDPLMRAVSKVFDPKRHHLLVDANRVLEMLRAADSRLLPSGELAETARTWIDAASALRREAVNVSAENLLLKVTAGHERARR